MDSKKMSHLLDRSHCYRSLSEQASGARETEGLAHRTASRADKAQHTDGVSEACYCHPCSRVERSRSRGGAAISQSSCCPAVASCLRAHCLRRSQSGV